MNRTCDKRVKDCCVAGGSGEFGNPLANLSSEAPDVETFFSLNWMHRIPGGGEPTGKYDCFSVCESEASQQDADLCARQQAEECAIINEPPIKPCQTDPCPGPCDNPQCDIPPVFCQTPPCNVPPVPCQTPPCNPTPILYCNDAVTCGPTGCETTVPACVVTAGSKADANAIAASLCQHFAWECQFQRPRPPVPPVPPVPVCPSITGYGQTSPVVLNEGDSTVLSVTVAYTGAGPLIYVWYVNGFPLAITPGPSLNLNNVTVADSGTYALGISAPGCALVLSNEIVVDVNVSNIWDSLAWDAPVIYTSNPTPGSSSSTLVGGHFQMSSTCPAWPGSSAGGQGISCHGSLTYTGPLISCHLHIVTVGPGTVVSNRTLGPVKVFVDTVEIFNSDDTDDISITGTYDFDFNLPASVAALVEVDVAGILLTVCDPGIGCGGVQETFSWDGLLTVNP